MLLSMLLIALFIMQKLALSLTISCLYVAAASKPS